MTQYNLTSRYLPQKMKAYVHTEIWIQVFAVTLFIISKDSKLKCPAPG